MNPIKNKTASPTVKLPLRVDAAVLSKHRRPDEAEVVLKVSGIGNTSPYEYRGRNARAYVLRWEMKPNAHLLRIPLHLWQQNDHALAHDLLERHAMPLPIVVMVESPALKERNHDMRGDPSAPAEEITAQAPPAPAAARAVRARSKRRISRKKARPRK